MKTTQELHAARPTSPHLEIYRLQISSVLSIFHRLTGIALFGAVSAIAWWMIAWIFSGYNPKYFSCDCWVIKASLYLISFAAFYHTCTGIRHLVWDAGYGFSVKALHIGGWIAVIVALALTSWFWFL